METRHALSLPIPTNLIIPPIQIENNKKNITNDFDVETRHALSPENKRKNFKMIILLA